MSQKRHRTLLPTALVAGFIVATATGHPAQAQRGPAFMNSPGYQRALIESRKQRQQIQQDHAVEKPAATRPQEAKRKTRPR